MVRLCCCCTATPRGRSGTRDIVRGLRGRFRCIALDYPGFGLSAAREGYEFTPAEHADVVEQFSPGPRPLGRNDHGSGLGRPDRPRACLPASRQISGAGDRQHLGVAGKRRAHLRAVLEADGWSRGGILIRNFNAFVNLLIPMATKRRKPPKEVMAAYRGPFPSRVSRADARLPREILRSRAYLAEVERGLKPLEALPALILWGDRDIAFREAERTRFEGSSPSTTPSSLGARATTSRRTPPARSSRRSRVGMRTSYKPDRSPITGRVSLSLRRERPHLIGRRPRPPGCAVRERPRPGPARCPRSPRGPR